MDVDVSSEEAFMEMLSATRLSLVSVKVGQRTPTDPVPDFCGEEL